MHLFSDMSITKLLIVKLQYNKSVINEAVFWGMFIKATIYSSLSLLF